MGGPVKTGDRRQPRLCPASTGLPFHAGAGSWQMSQTEGPLTRAHLKTPRSAAIAGIVFSVLLTTILWLFRSSVPADPLDPGEWLATDTRAAALGLNLIPFAGVSFLWFIGVLRDRLGPLEDRFFATVLLGSAILFLAGLFAAAAAMGAVILTASNLDPGEVAHSATFKYARAAAYIIANVYTAKDGGRIHGVHLHHYPLHENSSALDRVDRIRAGAGSADRELRHELERHCPANLGAADQHPYSGRQSARHETNLRI
jgi:hypothetical protein